MYYIDNMLRLTFERGSKGKRRMATHIWMLSFYVFVSVCHLWSMNYFSKLWIGMHVLKFCNYNFIFDETLPSSPSLGYPSLFSNQLSSWLIWNPNSAFSIPINQMECQRSSATIAPRKPGFRPKDKGILSSGGRELWHNP